ncbi:hypothetical protein CCACVL1_06037 [Corchorus capsularis]|uniref:Uncharacterized protein n=1 Tax=Corchorus capsularis TaxID=210143 RepID=A0A1R3JHS4_COCAP|nr:hypothetical protein CCACVL1_06888 [Corchorus capsularis]OMO94374.1 hypothetical protein CCACVL1_06037 [Corchorus capsularis]
MALRGQFLQRLCKKGEWYRWVKDSSWSNAKIKTVSMAGII